MNPDSDAHVPIEQEQHWGWRFVVRSSANSPSAVSEELTGLCRAIYDCGEGFLRPREIELSENIQPEGRSLRELFSGSPDDRIDLRHVALSCSDGVPFQHLRALLEMDSEEERYIGSVEINQTSVNCTVDGDAKWVNREAHTTMYHAGEPQDGTPFFDPLEVRIHHAEAPSDLNDRTDFVFNLRVTARSSIWFEESERGRSNATKLHSFLDCLEERLSPEEIERLPRSRSEAVRQVF